MSLLGDITTILTTIKRPEEEMSPTFVETSNAAGPVISLEKTEPPTSPETIVPGLCRAPYMRKKHFSYASTSHVVVYG